MKLSEALLLYHDSDDESENKEICPFSPVKSGVSYK